MHQVRKMSIIKRDKEYCIEYTRCYFESGKDKRKNVNDKKLVSNLARARRAIIDIIRLNLEYGSSLLTLTYRENMQDYERAYKDFNKFVKRLEYRYKISLRYLRVIELQQRGAIHFHVVIFSPDFALVPYNEVYETWGHGAVHIRKIEVLDDVTADRIGNYLGKYLTKSKEIAVNKNIYSTSRNLKRPKKERVVIDDERLFAVYENYLAEMSSIVIDGKYENVRKFIKGKNF